MTLFTKSFEQFSELWSVGAASLIPLDQLFLLSLPQPQVYSYDDLQMLQTRIPLVSPSFGQPGSSPYLGRFPPFSGVAYWNLDVVVVPSF